MPFACIYVPNFPVAAALRAEPELGTCAIAIFEGKPPLEKIIAVNEKASQLGIAPGMSEAQGELCSELVLRAGSALHESSAHAALLDCAQSFSPCVEDSANDTVLLDLMGMESLLGPLPKIARAIFERAAALGLTANVAIASNPDAAQLAARGFAGITVIPADKEAEQLGPLPVAVLFADRLDATEQEDANRLLETLERWGIRNLRALAALPDVALSERLGQKGLHLQQLARGAAMRTLVPIEAPSVFEEAVELDHPIVLLEPLAFLLNRLLEQICARLGSRALATQELRLALELSNLTGVDDDYENLGIPSESDDPREKPEGAPSLSCFVRQGGDFEFLSPANKVGGALEKSSHRQTHFVRKLSLPIPMLDPKVFLKLLQLDLNAHPPGAPIVKIHLSAEPARPRSAQGGLFLPPAPEPEKLELTLARIAGIVGVHKVGAIELLDTHHPEGFRMRRFVAEVARKTPQKTTHDSNKAQAAITALRRFRPALRANVTLESGQPVRLYCPKKKDVQGEVLWKAGPWRFSGDWWERDAWSRDEWDLALRHGEAISFYRLVHDLLGAGWFVEGTYD
ncbi:MAG TPA: DNA polymerase Y family protein [Candidatus Sulfotelmatobacter sp.]|nr:DNA polymerase Y family protein [Candidatus Sulfotelmatobacter sp.]